MRLLPFVSLTVLMACGGGKSSESIDARKFFDAPPPGIDAPPACEISKMDFGSIGAVLEPEATYDADASGTPPAPVAFSAGALNNAGEPDIVFVELYAGFAPFGTAQAPTQFMPGTYQLSGAQLQYKTCGVCVSASAKATANGSGGEFMATGGTVKVTQIGNAVNGMFAWELTNVTFEQVTYMEGTSTPVGNNCTFKIGSATFSGTMVAPMNKPSSKPGRVRVKLTRNR